MEIEFSTSFWPQGCDYHLRGVKQIESLNESVEIGEENFVGQIIICSNSLLNLFVSSKLFLAKFKDFLPFQ